MERKIDGSTTTHKDEGSFDRNVAIQKLPYKKLLVISSLMLDLLSSDIYI